MNLSPLVKEIQKGLVVWYDFKPASKLLYIGDYNDAIADYFVSKSKKVVGENEAIDVTIVSNEKSVSKDFLDANKGGFDYIVNVEGLEKFAEPTETLGKWYNLLNKSGKCLLALNNRLGIKYFCGDRDKYTHKNFDGIDNYRYTYSSANATFLGRMYSKAEIESCIKEAGFAASQFYSVFSDLQNPSIIFKYGYIPREDVTNRIFPTYNHPKTVFLDEGYIYPALIDNDMFHQMANGFFIEVEKSESEHTKEVLQVTTSMDRSPADAMVTIVYADNHVEKRNVYPEGRLRLEQMVENSFSLKEAGVEVVPLSLGEKGLSMPYIDAPTGQLYLRKLLLKDKNEFLSALDLFYRQIMKSSKVDEPDRRDGMGPILRYGYPDLVPLNSFFVDGSFVFFDQEFREDYYPANVMAMRMISMLYYGNPEFELIIPEKDLYERYDLNSRMSIWKDMEGRFLRSLRNEDELREYRNSIRKNQAQLNNNRFRINYTEDEFDRYFKQIFRDVDTRKLILFGSGRYAEHFLKEYESVYTVHCVLDNNKSKWGNTICDIDIKSPDYLNDLKVGEYKVIICVKDYYPIVKQLETMGVYGYGIYNPAMEYERELHPIKTDKKSGKKYHVGYLSGTFDLFHVGHLNILKRAKEMCDYLIVGVVTDEGTKKHKGGVVPFVPFEERMEIVKACRYVDEVVAIPVDHNGPKEAYDMYHFDVQFNGTDHMNEPYWIEAREYLRERGSDMIFLPYTLNTNSTNLKALINEKLID